MWIDYADSYVICLLYEWKINGCKIFGRIQLLFPHSREKVTSNCRNYRESSWLSVPTKIFWKNSDWKDMRSNNKKNVRNVVILYTRRYKVSPHATSACNSVVQKCFIIQFGSPW